MTANEILNKYLEALEMSSSSPITTENVILDIIKYLDYKESGGDADPLIPQYKNDKLWKEITEKSVPYPSDCNAITLIQLRIILEKYKILENEKDGM